MLNRVTNFGEVFPLFAVCFSAFHSRNLLTTWQQSAFNDYCTIAFVGWLLALLISCYAHGEHRTKVHSGVRFTLSGIGVGLTLAAQVAELRVVGHMGLAIALVGLFYVRLRDLIGIFLAISWMPATGWLLAPLLGDQVSAARLIVVAFGLLVACSFLAPKCFKATRVLQYE